MNFLLGNAVDYFSMVRNEGDGSVLLGQKNKGRPLDDPY